MPPGQGCILNGRNELALLFLPRASLIVGSQDHDFYLSLFTSQLVTRYYCFESTSCRPEWPQFSRFRGRLLRKTTRTVLPCRYNTYNTLIAAPYSSSGIARTNAAPRSTDGKYDIEALYRFISGRWLWNEEKQLACRYVKFDLLALLRLAASAIGAKSCNRVLKISEGQYNKAFQLTMDDGREVIAKLPNPNAGRPHFTTACEVATMDFV
jgi:hypothetical protein